MVAKNPLYVNDPNVSNAQEKDALLTSYAVAVSAHGRPDVNLRLHGEDRACVVHLPADLLMLREHLDLTPSQRRKADNLIVTARDDGQRLHFVSIRKASVAAPQPAVAIVAPVEVREARITRYFYEIATNKQKLTLYIGLEWVLVTNHVTIAKIIAAMDTPAAGEVEVIPLRHAVAADLAPIVQRLADVAGERAARESDRPQDRHHLGIAAKCPVDVDVRQQLRNVAARRRRKSDGGHGYSLTPPRPVGALGAVASAVPAVRSTFTDASEAVAFRARTVMYRTAPCE